MLLLLAGCASRTTRVAVSRRLPPALTATRRELIQRYQDQADAVNSLNAAVRLTAQTGSAFSGVIKDYHQITALVVAERPGRIRMVGQAPVVGTDIFDMASNGKTFHMYIPSKKRFLVGPAAGNGAAKNAIENLRPQPLFDALIWGKIPPNAPVVLEEEDRQQPPSRAYVLTVLHRNGEQLGIDRRIWFNRSDLHVERVETFGKGGRIESDIQYGDWRKEPGNAAFPWQIVLWRPHDDYKLKIDVRRVTLNPPIRPGQFTLAQPPGTHRVELGRTGGRP